MALALALNIWPWHDLCRFALALLTQENL